MVLERYAKLLLIGKDDLTSLKKMIQWPKQSFKQLTEVLQRFEVYSTLDATGSGNAGRIAQGLKAKVTGTLLGQISKINPADFTHHCRSILNQEKSLCAVLKELKEKKKVDDVKEMACNEAQVKSFEVLQTTYPGKFRDSVINSYVGADCKQTNKPGDMLAKYVNSVRTNVEYDPEVQFKTLANLEDLTLAEIYKFNVVIFDMKSVDKDYLQSVIDLFSVTRESLRSVLVLLPNGNENHVLLF